MIRGYVRYLKLQRGMSGNTLDAYQRDLQKLLDYLGREGKDVLEVTLEDLQHFAAGLHDIGIHPRSQCRILSGIRSFYHFLLLYFSVLCFTIMGTRSSTRFISHF